MSQHDMDISQADADTGITVRAAINAALQALASCSLGASAPSTTYAGQLWFDSANNLLKQRNETNAGWNIIGATGVDYMGLVPIASAATITAQHTFNPGSTAPFVLNAACQGQTVTGLKADTAVSAGMKISSNDTTPGNLNGKLVAGAMVSLTEGSDGGNETLTVAVKNNHAETVEALSDAATIQWDCETGNIKTVTIGAARTLGGHSSGTPVSGQMVIFRVKASGAYLLTLTTGSSGTFRYGSDITVLTANASGKTDYIGVQWNSADSRWDVIAYVKGY